jgi:hypothetical protein
MTTTVKLFNGSTFVDADVDKLYMLEYEDNGSSALDKLSMSFNMTILDDTPTVGYQNEAQLDIDGTVVFGGKIDKPQSEFPIYSVTAYSYGVDFLDRIVDEVFTNLSPEQIAEYVIETYTDLTYVSTISSGVTIERIVFRSKTVAEVLKFVCDILDASINTNYLREAHLELRGTTSSGVTLTVGTNITEKPMWDYNRDFIITKVIVEGGLQNFNTSETFTATASQTSFILSYEPAGDIKVTVNGTAKTPTVDGSTTGDYTSKKESKEILFAAGQSAGATVVVTYSYSIPVKVEQESAVYDSYGNRIIKERVIRNKSIKARQEARTYAQKFLAQHGSPAKAASLVYYGFNTALRSGRIVRVVDAEEGIDEDFLITSVKYRYPEDIMIIEVGTNEYVLYDWLAEVMERLKSVQQEDTNADKLQVARLFPESLIADLPNAVTWYTSSPQDSFIFGHDTLGFFRSAFTSEPDCSRNGNHGTWSGTAVDGSQYDASGHRLVCGKFNGTDNKVTASSSVAGARTIYFAIKPAALNRDILKLASGVYAGINPSGVVTMDGVTGKTIWVNNATTPLTVSIGAWSTVFIEFNSVTANAIVAGFSSGYYSGLLDEFMIFNATLTAQDRADIIANKFGSQHALFSNCKLWYAYDKQGVFGNRRSALVEVT